MVGRARCARDRDAYMKTYTRARMYTHECFRVHTHTLNRCGQQSYGQQPYSLGRIPDEHEHGKDIYRSTASSTGSYTSQSSYAPQTYQQVMAHTVS